MTTRKSKEKEKVVDKFASAKEKRAAAWEAKQKEEKAENSRDEFRKFFIKIKGKLNLAGDMEEVIWIHFKSAGFNKKEKFEEGIKHFGYNLQSS